MIMRLVAFVGHVRNTTQFNLDVCRPAPSEAAAYELALHSDNFFLEGQSCFLVALELEFSTLGRTPAE